MALGGSTSMFANNSGLLSEEIITKLSNSINKQCDIVRCL